MGSLQADSTMLPLLYDDLVQGEIIFNNNANKKIRDSNFTNVFLKLVDSKEFSMTKWFEKHEEGFVIEGKCFEENDGKVIFGIGYYAAIDERYDGNNALALALDFPRNRLPPWFEQYKEGPGNVCLIPISADVKQPTRIGEIYFVRDNVAVAVRNNFGRDVLAFANFLDECILASSMDSDGEVGELVLTESQSIIREGTQQTNALYGTIINQTHSSEQPAPSSVSPEEDKAITPKSLKNIYPYLVICVILLFAFFYFLRKKPIQINP